MLCRQGSPAADILTKDPQADRTPAAAAPGRLLSLPGSPLTPPLRTRCHFGATACCLARAASRRGRRLAARTRAHRQLLLRTRHHFGATACCLARAASRRPLPRTRRQPPRPPNPIPTTANLLASILNFLPVSMPSSSYGSLSQTAARRYFLLRSARDRQRGGLDHPATWTWPAYQFFPSQPPGSDGTASQGTRRGRRPQAHATTHRRWLRRAGEVRRGEGRLSTTTTRRSSLRDQVGRASKFCKHMGT